MPHDSETHSTPTRSRVDLLDDNAFIAPWMVTQRNASDTTVDLPERHFPGTFTEFDPENSFWPPLAHGGEGAQGRERGRPSDPLPVSQHPVPDVGRGGFPRRSTRNHTPNASYGGMQRTDISARNSLRDVIFSAILAENLHATERAELLEDCRNSAVQSQLGVPFRDIISEPMEPFGVPPLMYELMSCKPDWDAILTKGEWHGLEVVIFLIKYWRSNVITHGNIGLLAWVVRTACLRRLDEEEGNSLFQYLRTPMHESQDYENGEFDYDAYISQALEQGNISTKETGYTEFTAIISLPTFEMQLARAQSLNRTCVGEKVSAQEYKGVVVEFLAAQRAWALQIQSNSLKLELLHGVSDQRFPDASDAGAVHIDARIKVIGHSFTSGEIGEDEPVELLLPRALLRSDTSPGPSSRVITLNPCFLPGYDTQDVPRGFDDPRLLNDDLLLLELTVRLSRRALPALPDKRPMQPEISVPAPTNAAERASIPIAGPSGIHAVSEDELDDLYFDDLHISDGHSSTGLLEDDPDGWEQISQVDETEDNDGSWVKASWSGKDEET